MAKIRRILRACLPVALLPAAMGSNCGLALDFTETYLVTDPIDRITLDVDGGVVDAVAYERPALLIKRHTFGFESNLGPADFTVEDGVAAFRAHCKGRGKCSFDHMFEMPYGIALELTMTTALVSVGYLDADLTATFDDGFVHGVRLQVPQLEVTAHDADIELDYAAAPASIVIELDRGDVALELPPGSYQCALDSDDGDVDTGAIVCDDTATAVIDVHVGRGDITLTEAAP